MRWWGERKQSGNDYHHFLKHRSLMASSEINQTDLKAKLLALHST